MDFGFWCPTPRFQWARFGHPYEEYLAVPLHVSFYWIIGLPHCLFVCNLVNYLVRYICFPADPQHTHTYPLFLSELTGGVSVTSKQVVFCGSAKRQQVDKKQQAAASLSCLLL